MGTNKAEELAHSIAVKIWNDYMARPYNSGKPYNFSFKQLELSIEKEVNNYRQSEIDELTKEVEDWKRECKSYCNQYEELLKEVERHKGLIEKAIVFGIDIECSNIQRDYEITALQQFLTTH